MNLLEQLRAALGLKAEATETEVLAAVTAANTAVTTHTANMKKILETAGLKADAKVEDLVTHLQSSAADLKKLGEAAGIKDGVTVDKLVTHLQSRTGTDDETKQLNATIISLQTQVNTMTAERTREAAERDVDQAIKDGKILPPSRDFWIGLHQKDPAGTKKEIEKLPSIHAGGLPPRRDPAGDKEAALDAADLEVCELMGIDLKAYAETKKSLQVEAL